MYKHSFLFVCLLSAADCAASVKPVPKAPDPPGLSFVLPAPKGPAPKLPPNVLLAPFGKLPGSGTILKLPTPLPLIAPSAQPPPMRLLVLRDDDRAAIRTFHPLLTSDVPVSTYLVKPVKPKAKR